MTSHDIFKYVKSDSSSEIQQNCADIGRRGAPNSNGIHFCYDVKTLFHDVKNGTPPHRCNASHKRASRKYPGPCRNHPWTLPTSPSRTRAHSWRRRSRRRARDRRAGTRAGSKRAAGGRAENHRLQRRRLQGRPAKGFEKLPDRTPFPGPHDRISVCNRSSLAIYSKY